MWLFVRPDFAYFTNKTEINKPRSLHLMLSASTVWNYSGIRNMWYLYIVGYSGSARRHRKCQLMYLWDDKLLQLCNAVQKYRYQNRCFFCCFGPGASFEALCKIYVSKGTQWSRRVLTFCFFPYSRSLCRQHPWGRPSYSLAHCPLSWQNREFVFHFCLLSACPVCLWACPAMTYRVPPVPLLWLMPEMQVS